MSDLHTFVFLDLAGFTAMTEAHGDEHAADVAEVFIDGVRALLESHEACEVKTMGDAVMAHSRSADRALCLAECAVGELGGGTVRWACAPVRTAASRCDVEGTGSAPRSTSPRVSPPRPVPTSCSSRRPPSTLPRRSRKTTDSSGSVRVSCGTSATRSSCTVLLADDLPTSSSTPSAGWQSPQTRR